MKPLSVDQLSSIIEYWEFSGGFMEYSRLERWSNHWEWFEGWFHCRKAFFSQCLSVVRRRPSSLMSTECVVLLRGDWAIFCHAGSGWVGRVWSAREKIFWNISPLLGIEPGQPKGQTVRYIYSPTELSWLALSHTYSKQWDEALPRGWSLQPRSSILIWPLLTFRTG